ncbi:MAG TPA: hypothetical protein VFF36_13135, partial [Planctomycetota bacterium]|nr:hypothetical protein [Planctomycetota bacterium]
MALLALLSTARRVLLAPSLPLLTLVAAGSSFLAVLLASQALGGDQGFVDEVRGACLPFAGALVLSLAEPLDVGREVREGWLRLRVARGGGFALLSRWAGLLLGTLPTVLDRHSRGVEGGARRRVEARQQRPQRLGVGREARAQRGGDRGRRRG